MSQVITPEDIFQVYPNARGEHPVQMALQRAALRDFGFDVWLRRMAAEDLQRFTTATDDNLLADAFDRSEEIRAGYRIHTLIPGQEPDRRRIF